MPKCIRNLLSRSLIYSTISEGRAHVAETISVKSTQDARVILFRNA